MPIILKESRTQLIGIGGRTNGIQIKVNLDAQYAKKQFVKFAGQSMWQMVTVRDNKQISRFYLIFHDFDKKIVSFILM